MTWLEIGRDNLKAAKRILNDHPRSSSSHAYYAAHAVLTDRLIKAGYVSALGRQTPPHAGQMNLINRHLIARGHRTVRQLRAIIWRLYAYRLDADYRRTAAVDRARAKECVRDVSTFFQLLGVQP